MVLIGFVASLLFLSLIAYSFPIFAQGPDSAPGKPEVIAVSGIVPGKGLIVHIWVVVPPGVDRNEAASAALANQGARPFTADEFSTIALKWDQFSDGDPGNDFVTQNYNPKNDPTNGNGITALLNTHNSWNGVTASIFEFEYGGVTDRCPSLVDECPGFQTFDGKNDVAWLRLKGSTTLGVTWTGISIDEADMALNTKFNWATDGVDDADFDVETVYLHENGHAAGLGHSAVLSAIMYPSYQQLNRVLQQDDINGINFLYPGPVLPNDPTTELFPDVTTNNSPTVSISNPSDNSSFDSATVISFAGSASDTEDVDISASLTWISSIDGSIGSGGSFSTTLSDGTHTITAHVTDSGGKTSSKSITITIGTLLVTGTAVGVDSITYSTEGGKNKDKHLTVSVHVSDDSGNNVSGASISVQLSNGNSSWTATGTTSSTGDAGFTLKKAPSGTYTTTITNVIASGLTWDGLTPPNTFTK